MPKPEQVFYEIDYDGAEPRYRVTFEGQRLIDAYGVTGFGRHLQETINPAVWSYLAPIYQKCVETAL